jgi:hypothetical protein
VARTRARARRAGLALALAIDGRLKSARVVIFERPRFTDEHPRHPGAAAGRAVDAQQRVDDPLAIGGELNAANARRDTRQPDQIAGRETVEHRLRGAQNAVRRADTNAAFIDDEQQQSAGGCRVVRRRGGFSRRCRRSAGWLG